MKSQKLSTTIIALTIASLAIFGAFTPASAQPKERTFPETGKVVSGRFLDYWTNNGGLAQQGYPISDEFQEKSDLDGKTYTVQYFERAVFEMHPENKAPYDVLLSQLGTFRFKEKYPQGEPLPPAGVVPTPVAGCTSNLTPGKWTGPLREQVNFKGEGITGSAVISANMELNVACNGAFTGTGTTTSFTAQGNKGVLRVLTCSATELPVASFNGKQVVRPDGLHLLMTGGMFTSGKILCKSPLRADKTEVMTGRPINPTDIKVESYSEGKITGSEWLANPLTDAVLAEIYDALPNAQIQTTNTGHWELTYQGK